MIDGVVRKTKGGDTLTGCPSRGGGRLLGRSGAAICRLTSMRVFWGKKDSLEKMSNDKYIVIYPVFELNICSMFGENVS
jgi:hypothetical protein